MYIQSHSNPLISSTVLKFKDVIKRSGISLQQKEEILSVGTEATRTVIVCSVV